MLGIGGALPVVASVDDALQFRPTELVIGIAPRGGVLPDPWRRQIVTALRQGIDLVSGLHYVMAEDEEFAQAARAGGATISDVRIPPDGLSTADFIPHRPGAHVVTFVGSDCVVGKMTAALEMQRRRRASSDSRRPSLPTGQTGIMLEGSGIAIDRVIGDFMAGAAERMVQEACEKADWVFVEGRARFCIPHIPASRFLSSMVRPPMPWCWCISPVRPTSTSIRSRSQRSTDSFGCTRLLQRG